MRDIDTIDSELQLVATLRRSARERGGPLPSIAVADALLDERRELTGLPRLTRCLDKRYWTYYLRHQRGPGASSRSRDPRSIRTWRRNGMTPPRTPMSRTSRSRSIL